jgi:hypothetical protein
MSKMKAGGLSQTAAKALGIAIAVLGSLVLAGCPNPNSIGVQEFGTVNATCVLASNNQPVAGVLVSVGGVTATVTTNSAGQVTIPQVEIGTHTVDAHAAGLDGNSPTVTVTENTTTPVTVLMSPSQ